MDEIINCPECGHIFAKTPMRGVCDSCYPEDKKKLEKVLLFLRKKTNRTALIVEVSEATGVPIETIERFIKEGKVRTKDYPNLGYPCKRCGGTTQKGSLCETCLRDLGRELHHSEKALKAEAELKERIRKMEEGTYLFKEDKRKK